MSCKHRSIEIVSPDEVNSIVRCINCKEIIGEWTHEHLQERFENVFGDFNMESIISTFTNSFPDFTLGRELTEEERVELR